MEEWLAKAHPDVPTLPWISDNGREICSMSVSPIEQTGGILVELYDAHGREAVRTGDRAAIGATATVLGVKATELTFLPVVRRPGLRLVRSSVLPRARRRKVFTDEVGGTGGQIAA